MRWPGLRDLQRAAVAPLLTLAAVGCASSAEPAETQSVTDEQAAPTATRTAAATAVSRPTVEAATATRGLATRVPVTAGAATTQGADRSSCSPAYPTVCIPPPPPDLDCKDIPFRRFTVLPPDPHRFDGADNDGAGCES